MSRIIRHTNLRKGGLCSCIVNSKKKIWTISLDTQKNYISSTVLFFFPGNTERDISRCEYKLNIYWVINSWNNIKDG